MSSEIDQILDIYHAADLSSMANEARLITLTTSGRPKRDDVLNVLRQRFFTPERIRAAYAKLSTTEKGVLNRILLHKEATPTRVLRRELVKAKLVTEAPVPEEPNRLWGYSTPRTYEGSPAKKKSTIFEDVIARFTLYGLVFTRRVEGTSGNVGKQRLTPGSLLYVPQIVRKALPEPTPIPLLASELQPERIVASDSNRLLRDLYLYWDYARRGGINLLVNGTVGKRELKVLNGLMLVPDPAIDNARKEEEMAHLHFLRMLLQGMGLLRSVSGQLRPTASDPLDIPEFWRAAVEQQMLVCLKRWETSLNGAETVTLESSDNPRISHARTQLLRMLAASGEAEWMSVDDLLENFWATEVDFLYAMHAQVEESNRWYGGTFRGSYYYGDKDKLVQAMQASERTFIEKCLDDSLSLLGLVDRGHLTAAGKETNLYRFNQRGRRVVAAHFDRFAKLPDAQSAADTGRVLLQPNFHLVAMGPVPLAVLAQLDLFAVRLQVGVGAFEYELTRDSVYQAQQNGMDAVQIRTLLVEFCAGPLPQNVDRTLSEWAQSHERIVFRTGVDLLQTGEAALLEKLTALGAVAAQVERTLTPSLALLNGGGVARLVTALKEAGHLPIVSDALPAAADKSIRLDENGAIHLLHPFPSLYLEGRLAKVAERALQGQWRLLESSVRRAGGSRTKVTDLLQELAALSQSPLPDALVERIKAWGSYYGKAGMARVILLEFQSRAVLDELLAMPDLSQRLRPFDEKQPLAIVTEKEAAQVKKRLEGLGVTLKDGISRA
ncbi:MAG: helicase-associated domain-containing protein [Chloroflexi bacterium]|nr:helicase-associated domain-containing protein [Chloroflexota bacterium]